MPIVMLIVWVLIFCIVGYLGFWICDQAGFPPPVRWLWGGLMLIILLLWIAGQLPVAGPQIKWLH